jgi:hypothetical protein
MKINNPVIDSIPEGQEVTVFLTSGASATGTDDTTKEEAEKGIFVIYSQSQDTRATGGKNNVKTYLSAAHVIGFELYYNA